MIRKDDRTAEERKTHRWAVVAHDKFMSGWGEAKGGVSRVAWACECQSDAKNVARHIRARSDMKYVNVVFLPTYRAPRSTAHFHVYVIKAGDERLR